MKKQIYVYEEGYADLSCRIFDTAEDAVKFGKTDAPEHYRLDTPSVHKKSYQAHVIGYEITVPDDWTGTADDLFDAIMNTDIDVPEADGGVISDCAQVYYREFYPSDKEVTYDE